ncbi:hypothetical protein ACFCXH_00715 [Streptomyces nojiriensis]|uniref:hypothetical protein n=1 Tax=Streptomyces nojiriensis TaxID=66374 RepID=UPI0035D771A6
MTVRDPEVENPATWDDLFVRDVDEQQVQCVRPADTDRPTWSLYEAAVYRGTVTAESDGGRPLWQREHLQQLQQSAGGQLASAAPTV